MTEKTINYRLKGFDKPARLNLGNDNWVDVIPVETQGMKEAWFRAVFGDKVPSSGDAEVEPGAAARVRVEQRVCGWNLELDDGPLPFAKNKSTFDKVPFGLMEEIHKFILELDIAAKKAAGTDDPNG